MLKSVKKESKEMMSGGLKRVFSITKYEKRNYFATFYHKLLANVV